MRSTACVGPRSEVIDAGEEPSEVVYPMAADEVCTVYEGLAVPKTCLVLDFYLG